MKKVLLIIVMGAVVIAGVYLTTRPTVAPRHEGFFLSPGASAEGHETGTASVIDRTGTYADPSGFSFKVPDGYAVNAVTEPGAETVFVARAGTGQKIQMYITAYDEPVAQFGRARIKKDLPGLDLSRAKEFQIADGRGVSFDDSTGHEIWFAAGTQLYQVTAPAGQMDAAQEIVSTFSLK